MTTTTSSLTVAPDVPTQMVLTEEETAHVNALAAAIDPRDPVSISNFGEEVTEHVSDYTKALYEAMQGREATIVGDKLRKVLVTAQSVNNTRRFAKWPVVGKALGRIVKFKERLIASVSGATAQIEETLDQIGAVRTQLTERIGHLEQMFAGVKTEYRLLGLHAAAARKRRDELREQAAQLQADGDLNPEQAQDLADLSESVNRLDKRAADFALLQESALQTLPQIRIVQNTNYVLKEKFDTFKTTTVNAWRRQIALATALEEQQDAVSLADAIDDTTNTLLRRNAELLRSNAVGSAKAGQRGVIDIKTLEFVQDQIIQTCQEVLDIQRRGEQERQGVEAKLANMQAGFVRRLTDRSKAA